jgi:hypothetical protein
MKNLKKTRDKYRFPESTIKMNYFSKSKLTFTVSSPIALKSFIEKE